MRYFFLILVSMWSLICKAIFLTGEEYPISFKPYVYYIEGRYPFSKEDMESAQLRLHVRIEGGWIMGEDGDFNKSEITLTPYNYKDDIFVMWDTLSIGEIYLDYEDYITYPPSTINSIVVNPISYYLLDNKSITDVYGYIDTLVCTNISVKDVWVYNGGELRINGIHKVTIEPNFYAEAGSTVSVKSYTPGLPKREAPPTSVMISEGESTVSLDSVGFFDNSLLMIDESVITLRVDKRASSAYLIVQSIYNGEGRTVELLKDIDKQYIDLKSLDLSSGKYVCSLIVNGVVVKSEKLELKQ